MRLRTRMAAVIAAIGVGGGIWGAMGPASASAATGIQVLKNHSNKDVCLSSLGNRWNGAGVGDYTCNGSANQKWNIEDGAYIGEFNLQSIGSSGYCLQQQPPYQDYQLQDLWQCSGGDSTQLWVLYGGAYGGGFEIRPLLSLGFCLSSMGYGSNSEPNLFGCNGSPNQSWGTA